MVKNKIQNLIERQEEAQEQAQSFNDLFGVKGEERSIMAES